MEIETSLYVEDSPRLAAGSFNTGWYIEWLRQGVSGPLVASGMEGVAMNTVCHVGSLLWAIIRIKGDRAVLQVYENTAGCQSGVCCDAFKALQ
jgi:hypothetical protein